jgi:hypothetical protein
MTGGYTLIMSRYAALREHDDTSNGDHIIVLHDLTWEDYQRLLEIRGDRSASRISYLEGVLGAKEPLKSTFSRGGCLPERNGVSSSRISTWHCSLSVLDRGTLTQAVRDFRKALERIAGRP